MLPLYQEEKATEVRRGLACPPLRPHLSLSNTLRRGQLKIAEGLELAGALRDELLVPKPKAEKPGDDLEGWRGGNDDDLMLAVAMSVWAAERFLRKADSVPAGGLGYPGVVGG